VGIPAVLVTALPPTARMMKASRIVQGVGITNPWGDPMLSLEAEQALRERIAEQCLRVLTAPVAPAAPTGQTS
jgi:hypothetical protein